MTRLSISLVLVMAIALAVSGVRLRSQEAAAAAAVATNIPFVEAKPILETLREDLLPPDLQARTPTDIQAVWPDWVARQDASIRSRLEGGDEDSIVNLALFGVTFTTEPRVKGSDILALGTQGRTADMLRGPVIRGRIDDMVAGIKAPGANERLQFARQVIERKGIDPTNAAGQDQLRRYLEEEIGRVLAEYETHTRGPELSLPFGDRGLSSDTSIYTDFAIDRALDAIRSGGKIGAGAIRRVAIVGPGLDFTNKREGYDFYPQQTFQPFAVIDSLVRLDLAGKNDLRVTTFDLSLRINHHLEAARERARAGDAYTLQLPLETDWHLNPDLVEYWKRFGASVGGEGRIVPLPPGIDGVSLRAVSVPPPVVLSIVPRDLNIVLQRLEPLPADERFDLVIATNIFIYYGLFEQSLALANVAAMLRPGGYFLSNNDPIVILPTIPMDVVGYVDVVYSDQLNDKDRLTWCLRR